MNVCYQSEKEWNMECSQTAGNVVHSIKDYQTSYLAE